MSRASVAVSQRQPVTEPMSARRGTRWTLGTAAVLWGVLFSVVILVLPHQSRPAFVLAPVQLGG